MDNRFQPVIGFVFGDSRTRTPIMVKTKRIFSKQQPSSTTPLKTSVIVGSDDDDETPEVVGLGSAKEDVLGRQRAVKEFQAS